MMKSHFSPTREKGVFFFLLFPIFAVFRVKGNSLCRWSVGTGVLRCLCKCHVVLLKPCIFNHSRSAIFLSIPSLGRTKKHLEATGGSRVFWKDEGRGGLYRNASSVKANAIRNREQLWQCEWHHSRFLRPEATFGPIFDTAPGSDHSSSQSLCLKWELGASSYCSRESFGPQAGK